jgi:hypothetical protein
VFFIARVGETEGAEELVLEVFTTVEDVLGSTEDDEEAFVELVVGTLEVLELFEVLDLLVLEEVDVFEELTVEVFVDETDETFDVVEVFEVLTGEVLEDFVELVEAFELVVGIDEVEGLVELVDDLLLVVDETVV